MKPFEQKSRIDAELSKFDEIVTISELRYEERWEAEMHDPENDLEAVEFCELKQTIESAHDVMSSEQLLEVADAMHDEIRDRGDDPKSGPPTCPT